MILHHGNNSAHILTVTYICRLSVLIRTFSNSAHSIGCRSPCFTVIGSNLLFDEYELMSMSIVSLTGLELMLNINQDEYLETNNQGAGAVVVIHPANRMPFPEDEGLLAKQNQMTSFDLTRV